MTSSLRNAMAGMRPATAPRWWRLLPVAWAVVPWCWGSVLINEIHYHPDVKTEPVEFVELYNDGFAAVDLSGWAFDRGIGYTFPVGATLLPQGYAVVSQDPVALQAKYGVDSWGPFEGRLSNDGESIRLVDATGAGVDTVTYRGGFPWPVVGDPPGYSIELVHSSFDNDLGGNWRPSLPSSAGTSADLIEPGGTVRFRRGMAEASDPREAWRYPGFDDTDWEGASLPMGYGENWLATLLDDMRGTYRCFFVRAEFQVDDPGAVQSLTLQTIIDDGFAAWINGVPVEDYNLPTGDPTFEQNASAAIEDLNWKTFVLPPPSTYLTPGTNVLCVQVHNASLNNSSDCFLDVRLSAESGSAPGPTPGAVNSVRTLRMPPRLRQVDHVPEQPRSGEPVRIEVKATDEDGVSQVTVEIQTVDPGAYLHLADPAFATNWTVLAMQDDGLNGDQEAGDDVFSLVIPGSYQVHRRLIRYRIRAVDGVGDAVAVPYSEDAVPNFAYFVYDGVPAWQGAVHPGAPSPDGDVVAFDTNVTRRLPVYHLISKRADVEAATWWNRYGGENYPWLGTLVYDGKVYDHIRYRARGGVWRYAMVKNMWKFDFNPGHPFHARDDYGQLYPSPWGKLNFSAVIQQGDFQRRGEQGMFESVGFRLFNLCGTEASATHFTQFRVIDDASEAGVDQYDGDYWGLYLAVEQLDGRFLDAHGLPDGNLYKMEGGTGELNNQGPTAVTDRSDLDAFQAAYISGGPPESWWRENFNLPSYYSYRSIVEAIHHYDIGYGKNYFFYLNPETAQWQTVPWDLDLTWAEQMYGNGEEPFRSRVLTRPVFEKEYQNRVREIVDLLYNEDQGYALIDEMAALIDDATGGPSPADRDRMRWDYNPIMDNGAYSTSLGKALTGRFYQGGPPPTPDFPGMVQQMKDYVTFRMRYIDQRLLSTTSPPEQPSLTYTGPAGYPVNELSFTASPFQDGAGAFAAMAWRIGEVSDPAAPAYDPTRRPVYEITPVWESGALAVPQPDLSIPADVLRVGHAYRARVRYKNDLGWWGHWSEPVSFIAGSAANLPALQDHLVLTELMYHAPAGNTLDFLEFCNTSATLTLDIGGVSVASGVAYTFPSGTTLAPGSRVVVARQPDAVFLATYGLAADIVFGPFDGELSNGGERVTVIPPGGGAPLVDFSYADDWGWPLSADGAGHSLVPLLLENQGDRRLDYGGNWRPSTYLLGSPGGPDPLPPAGLVINEFAAHTDLDDPAFPGYDSNDWIELFNPAAVPLSLAGYYLSDDAGQLAKWAVPPTIVGAGSWISFDEISGFHNPTNTGFGLNKAGEEIYLSHLPGSAANRVVDAIRFQGQLAEVSRGRYPDGATAWFDMPPTRDAANQLDGPPAVVIREILFHPPGDNDLLEYIELVNPRSTTAALWNEAGAWRLAGGVEVDLGVGMSLAPGEALLMVPFDPADPVASNALVAAYGMLPGAVAMHGPWSGKLSDWGERIALESPQAPDAPGEPVSWVVVDEVIYSSQAPWPEGTDVPGEAIHRDRLDRDGNDPANWYRFDASPALPAPDVLLRIGGSAGPGIWIEWDAIAGFGYVVEVSPDPRLGQWNPVHAYSQGGETQFLDPDSEILSSRSYRLRIVE